MPTDTQPFETAIKTAHLWTLWPEWRTQLYPRKYDFFNLWFVCRGHGQLVRDGRPAELRPGICALLRPWGDYRAFHDPDRPITYVRIDFHFTNSKGHRFEPNEGELPPDVQFISDWSLAEAALRKVVTAFTERTDTGRALAEAYLRAFLLHMQHTAAHPGKSVSMTRILPALHAIQQQPHRHFRLHELAELVHLSVNQFTRLFRLAVNATPAQYIIQQRMVRARDLLDTSGLQVSEIAEMLGYPDVFAFSRQFRLKTGMSPYHWRTGH